MSIIQYCLGVMGTLLSWVLMKYFGRRTIYVGGLSILTVILFIVGFLSLGLKTTVVDNNVTSLTPGISWGIGSMLLIHTFVYDSSVGPVCYSLVPELAAGTLRQKSTVFARNVYNCVGIITGVLNPFMLNAGAWNWGAKTGFFWGGITLICAIICFFTLPEPKGRSYAELDILFEMKVPARKFKSTQVDVFALHSHVQLSTAQKAVF